MSPVTRARTIASVALSNGIERYTAPDTGIYRQYFGSSNPIGRATSSRTEFGDSVCGFTSVKGFSASRAYDGAAGIADHGNVRARNKRDAAFAAGLAIGRIRRLPVKQCIGVGGNIGVLLQTVTCFAQRPQIVQMIRGEIVLPKSVGLDVMHVMVGTDLTAALTGVRIAFTRGATLPLPIRASVAGSSAFPGGVTCATPIVRRSPNRKASASTKVVLNNFISIPFVWFTTCEARNNYFHDHNFKASSVRSQRKIA